MVPPTDRDFSHSNFLESPYLQLGEIGTNPSQQGHSNNAKHNVNAWKMSSFISHRWSFSHSFSHSLSHLSSPPFSHSSHSFPYSLSHSFPHPLSLSLTFSLSLSLYVQYVYIYILGSRSNTFSLRLKLPRLYSLSSIIILLKFSNYTP